LPAEAEVDCRSLGTKSSEGNAHLCRGGSCNQERTAERIAKAHLPARGFKAEAAQQASRIPYSVILRKPVVGLLEAIRSPFSRSGSGAESPGT